MKVVGQRWQYMPWCASLHICILAVLPSCSDQWTDCDLRMQPPLNRLWNVAVHSSLPSYRGGQSTYSTEIRRYWHFKVCPGEIMNTSNSHWDQGEVQVLSNSLVVQLLNKYASQKPFTVTFKSRISTGRCFQFLSFSWWFHITGICGNWRR